MPEKSLKRSINFAPDMLEALEKLEATNHTTTSELVRQFVEKGLNIEGHKQDVDFIAGIIRQEFTSVYHIEDIKAVMEQQTNRLAKMLMKSGKLDGAAFFLLIKVLMNMAHDGTEDEFDQMLNEAVTLGVDYMRQRCRMLYMSAPMATSGIKTNRTNTIGLGLKLNPRIDREYLGLTTEQAEEWEKNTKAEFKLWAGRKDACDATGMNDFYEIQQLAFTSWLVSGDVFILIKHEEPDSNRPYTLRLHVIEADRCGTPGDEIYSLLDTTEGKTESGNRIYDGVEVDKSGKAVAYHIRNTYPNQNTTEKTEWKRVEIYGKKTGLPNIIHIMTTERPEQYRGVSYLAQIIEPLLQLRRYTEAEITAAIIESFFTAFIKTETDASELPFNETDSAGEEEKYRYDPNEYEMGPGQVNVMNPGEDVEFGDPKRPASGFGEFVKTMCIQMGASMEIPADLLMKEFGSSYSASRGALLEAWKSFRMYREWFVSDFCRPIYEVWLSEAVATGRINAPGFWGDRRTKEAWLEAGWIGPSQGQLDPVKEITAEIMAVSEGFSTREDSTVRINGGDWNSNMNKLERENRKKEQISGEKGAGSNLESKTNRSDGGRQKNEINSSEIIRDAIREVIREILTETKKEEKKIAK